MGTVIKGSGAARELRRGRRPVTAEPALLIGRAFGQSPQYWINLQAAYDLKTAEREIRGRLPTMRPLAHA